MLTFYRDFFRHVHVQRLQTNHNVTKWEPHHGCKTTSQTLNRVKACILDGIRTSLIHWVSCGDIIINLQVGIIPHRDVRLANGIVGAACLGIDQGNPGRHLMHSGAQALQHPACLSLIPGFPQQLIPIHHDRIRSNDQPFLLRGNLTRLFNSQPADIDLRRFLGLPCLIKIRRLTSKGQPNNANSSFRRGEFDARISLFIAGILTHPSIQNGDKEMDRIEEPSKGG